MKAILAVLLLPTLAWAQGTLKAVSESESEFADYDLDTMKAGEWTLHETVTEMTGDDGKAVKTGHRDRKACVKADKAKVWIEVSSWGLEEKAADAVTLCEVDRKTRKVVKAWRSEKGVVATEANIVTDADEEPLPGDEGGSQANSAGRTSEKVKVGSREVNCDGLKVDDYHPDKNYKTIHSSKTVLFSADAPFRLRFSDNVVRRKYQIPEALNTDLKVSKALVKIETENGDTGEKNATRLVDFGTDAKPVVKLK